MLQLRVFLLGTPQIECEGEEVKLPHHKALALLAYLALNPGTHRRERLATLLWPDAAPKRAYAYLRNALWQLNQTPVTEWLVADRESIELRRDDAFWLDVAHVQDLLAACQTHGHAENEVCAACVPLLTEVVDTCTDGFMAGFTLEDSAEFDDWQFFQAENLREALNNALARLTHWHAEQKAYPQAITYARRWLALAPLQEAAHRQLMQLYAWDGQQNLALRQYQECVKVLEEALGASPSAETTELYEAIRARQIKPRAEADTTTISVVPGVPEQPAEVPPPVA
ncbi:MAG: AfsR/SARP family transcriptional regulator, partial [Anaerolineae bacterium]